MKLFTPKSFATKTSIGKVRVSAHSAKTPHFSSPKLSLKAPKLSIRSSRGKVKV